MCLDVSDVSSRSAFAEVGGGIQRQFSEQGKEMDGAESFIRNIRCQQLVAESFSPFGLVIDPSSVIPELINDGTTKRYPDLATLDLNTETSMPKIGIYISNVRSFPLRLAKLERHQMSSQVFIPLGMQKFIVVVARGSETPVLQSISAFMTSPGQGISLHRGTWHHGLIALNDGDRFAVVEGGNYRLDTQEYKVSEPIWLTDPLG